MSSPFVHFDDDGANKAPKGRSKTSREISVDRLRVSIASFDTMLSLLEYEKQRSSDAPRDSEIH